MYGGSGGKETRPHLIVEWHVAADFKPDSKQGVSAKDLNAFSKSHNESTPLSTPLSSPLPPVSCLEASGISTLGNALLKSLRISGEVYFGMEKFCGILLSK